MREFRTVNGPVFAILGGLDCSGSVRMNPDYQKLPYLPESCTAGIKTEIVLGVEENLQRIRLHRPNLVRVIEME